MLSAQPEALQFGRREVVELASGVDDEQDQHQQDEVESVTIFNNSFFLFVYTHLKVHNYLEKTKKKRAGKKRGVVFNKIKKKLKKQ